MSTKPATPPTAPAASASRTAATPAPAAAAPVKTRKKRAPVDPNETLEQQFVRLGTARVIRALTAIRLLKNLARMKPTDEQREKVFTALKEAMQTTCDAWKGGSKVQAEGFKL